MSADTDAERETGPHAPAPRRRRWPRIVGLLIVIPIAWVSLFVIGPAPFVLVVLLALFVDYLFGIRRRAEQKVDLRLRRRAEMRRAIERGGPSKEPTKRHVSPDPNEAEKKLYGKQMPGLIRGMWPHGRI